jgi:hypothetical protein
MVRHIIYIVYSPTRDVNEKSIERYDHTKMIKRLRYRSPRETLQEYYNKSLKVPDKYEPEHTISLRMAIFLLIML